MLRGSATAAVRSKSDLWNEKFVSTLFDSDPRDNGRVNFNSAELLDRVAVKRDNFRVFPWA